MKEIINRDIITLFRIQSRFNESLWYSFDGKFKNKLLDITGQSIPMPFEGARQSNNKVKLLSSVEDINMFPHWFNKEQIDKLFNSGYSLFKYEVENVIHMPKGEVLFDFNKVITVEEIQDNILTVYNSGKF